MFLWQVIATTLLACLFLHSVVGQDPSYSLNVKGVYRCERMRDGRLHLHFRAIDYNDRANEMVPVDANNDPLTGANCPLTSHTHDANLYVVDTYVNLATQTEDGKDCGMEVVSPNNSPQTYRWRFQVRRVEGGNAIGTKYTLLSECSSDDLDNTFVSTMVPIDVQRMIIEPENSINKIGNNGVQTGSELYIDGLFYPGQETIPNVNEVFGMFYYNCFAGVDTEEKIVDAQGCRIPSAAYAPAGEFVTEQQPTANQPQIISANGMKASEVGILEVSCARGFCTTENNPCCVQQRCGCTETGIIHTTMTHTDDIDVLDELAQDYFITDDLTPSPLNKKSAGLEGDMVYYVAKLTPGGAGNSQDLMSAKGLAVYNCRASTHQNFPPGQTTQYVDGSGCVIPGTEFSPDAEFMFNPDLSGANSYYVTSGQTTLTLQNKETVYHKCDTVICETENNPVCTNKLCGATDTTTGVKWLGDQGLEWQIDVKASPKLKVKPVNVANLVDDGIQEGSDLKMTGYFYPGEDGAPVNAAGMMYVDCFSYTNPGFTQNAEQFIDSAGCAIPSTTYAPTSGFMRTSAAGDRPVTIEATGATAQFVEGQDDIYIRCKRRYCLNADDQCCIQTCHPDCNYLQDTIPSNDYDSDAILIRNKLALRLLGVSQLSKPFIPVLTAVEGETIYFLSQLIPNGLNTNQALMAAKGKYLYNCRYSTNPDVPIDDSTLFVDQNGCMVDGTDFEASSEFVYDALLSGTNEFYIRSGLVTLKAQNKYTVYCTCMTGICTTVGHPRCQQRCSDEANAANTNFVEFDNQQILRYTINIKKSNRMGIAPERNADWRGPNKVIDTADLQFTGNFYPGEDIHPDAVGYYYHSCYLGTNEDVNRDRRKIIDELGCPVVGAPFGPSKFVRSSAAGNVPFTISASGKAQLFNGRGTFWVPCKVGYCTEVDDPCCQQRCESTCTSAVNTDIIHKGNIEVIEAELAAQLVGSSQIVTDPTQSIVRSGTAGQAIYYAAKLVPDGLSANDVIRSAKGFFVYNCSHDNNKNIPAHRETKIIDANGCRIPGAQLAPVDDFILNEDLSSENAYILTSGQVTLVDQTGYRQYFKCKTCVCTVPNHTYCTKRCGAQGSDNNVQCTGSPDITYNIGIFKQSDPPAALTLTGSDGSADLLSTGATVGEPATFGGLIAPSQSQGQLRNAAGAFFVSCFMTLFEPASGNVEDIPESERDYFIDDQGCSIPGSDFATDQECTGNTDYPPYEVDCGQFDVPAAGDWKSYCKSGYCNESNDIFCQQRCRPGVVVPDSVQLTGDWISGAFTATEPATTPGRTAIVSEEKRALIIALTTVIPCAIILGVALGACLLIRSQRGKMK